MTVLCWIGNNTLWKQYVMRRGRDSSIDLQGFMEALSRYEEPRRFAISWSESKRPWWEDPEFLQKSEDEWPKCSSEEPDTALNEVVKKQPVVTHSLVTKGSKQNPPDITKSMNCENFCTLTRLFRVTAYVLRFINNVKKSTKDRKIMKTTKPKDLSASEINAAENI